MEFFSLSFLLAEESVSERRGAQCVVGQRIMSLDAQFPYEYETFPLIMTTY
jgi:hypothetical protein